MSTAVNNTLASSTKNKKNKKKKKTGGAKTDDAGATPAINGSAHVDEDEGEDDEPGSPVKETPEQPADSTADITAADPAPAEPSPKRPANANGGPKTPVTEATNSESTANAMSDGDALDRLEALAKERDALRAEVTELRKSLETIQSTHEEKTTNLQQELDEARSGKEHSESQYRGLMGKVNTLKATLGERLKEQNAEIANLQTEVEETKEQTKVLEEENSTLQNDITRLQRDKEQSSLEAAELRKRSNLSQQNWVQERDELIQREAQAREEFEAAQQAMQEWEVMALNERSLREDLKERNAELEEEKESMREAYESISSDRDSKVKLLDTLQRRIQEEHEARKKELREVVETSQAQEEELRKQLQAAEQAATESTTTLESTLKELERALPFEKEVKEKNLLLGKLRHEAVILNDHLRKALRVLKKGKPEDNIDRHIVTNHFLHFLALDRSDPKKFQILQLIAALLNWTDEQREAAGLSRPGAQNSSLRIAMSPFRRTPSTPSLSSDLMLNDSVGDNKESLAELWSNFLEQEASGSHAGEGSQRGSRRGSVMSPTSEQSGLGIS